MAVINLSINGKKISKEVKDNTLLSDFIRDNFHLIKNVRLFTSENKMLFDELVNQSNNFQEIEISKFNIDKNLIDRVLKYASIKNIWKKSSNDEEKIEFITFENLIPLVSAAKQDIKIFLI